MARIVVLSEDYPDGRREGTGRFGSGETVVVGGGVIWNADDAAILGRPATPGGTIRDLDLEIQGRVVTYGDGARLGGGSVRVEGTDVLVGEEGLLGGFRHGLDLGDGRDNAVVNRGLIAGTEAAIRARGEVIIENEGLIGTAGDSLVTADRYHAIWIDDGQARIVNGGLISGLEMGLPAWRQAAIKAYGDARLDLLNEEDATVLAEFLGDAVMGGSSRDALTNRGTIVGDVDLRGGDDVLVNEGGIFGQVFLGSGDDVVTLGDDSSTVGDLALGAGDDLVEVEAGATISGGIAGGLGDDTYILAFGEDVAIMEEADGGHDTLHVGGEYGLSRWIEDVVLLEAPAGVPSAAVGNASDNDMRGSRGHDRVRGGEGDDRIKGRDGDDRLGGDRGDDRLGGGRGDDRLEGGTGDDRLSGGRGDDLLIGGKGGDRLRGGEGADVFQWERAGGRERDVVRDFGTGVDQLDLSALDLTLRDGGPSGRGAELWVVEKDDRVVLRADADGDGERDLTIVLKDPAGFGADDLLL